MPHTGSRPHRQPPAVHVSATSASHALHATAPVPHCPALWLAYGTHVFPLTHPAVHTQCPVMLHVSPAAHVAHAAAPVPHAVAVWLAYGRHPLFWQHPLQVAGSHTHRRFVASHLLPAPQLAHTAPPVPQAPFWSPVWQLPSTWAVQHPLGQLSAVHSHLHAPAAFTQRWSAAHCAALPHRHVPSLAQTLARAGSHVSHAPPPVPHAASP